MTDSPLLILLGATASGKTKLAVSLAQALNGEIISADSRQVFRGMDIGTGKDLTEYELDGQLIDHHLIDIRNAGEKYHVDAFKEDFYVAFKDITRRNKFPILCGGTGMYIHSLLQNQTFTAIPVNELIREKLIGFSKIQLCELMNSYPEQHRQHVDYSSMKRLIRGIEVADYLKFNDIPTKVVIPFNPIVFGLKSEISIRKKRILNRLEQRLDFGLLEEVKSLLANGVTPEMLTFYGLEYKFAVAHLSGELSYATFKERLGIAICQFAKRQETFFRKMEKDGVAINWLDPNVESNALKESALLLVRNKFQVK